MQNKNNGQLNIIPDGQGTYLLKGVGLPDLHASNISRLYKGSESDLTDHVLPYPKYILVDEGSFSYHHAPEIHVEVSQNKEGLSLKCSCMASLLDCCYHQIQALLSLIDRTDYRVFFDIDLRHIKLQRFAEDFGLEKEQELERFFHMEFSNGKLTIKPTLQNLLPVSSTHLQTYQTLFKHFTPDISAKLNESASIQRIAVFKRHKYYGHLLVELLEASLTKEGKVKNPLKPLSPLEMIWETNQADEIKFYSALSKFQNNIDPGISQTTIRCLKAIVKNPLELPFYLHDSDISENVGSSSLLPVRISKHTVKDISLTIQQKNQFYELSGSLLIDGIPRDIVTLTIKHSCFVLSEDALYLIEDQNTLDIINFLKKRGNNPLIHRSRFSDFRKSVLEKQEERIPIAYTFIPEASDRQKAEAGFDTELEKIIFLSDFGQHVMVIPVIRYAEVEIPVRSQKQIFGQDKKGNPFLVQRNHEAELQFISLLIKQHPSLEEQLDNGLQYFDIHKRHFLNEDWFLPVFEEWRRLGITILGFNEITGNTLNAHTINVSVKVLSGINWFNSLIKVSFGKKQASLKHIHKAIRSKTKYVQLDDETRGILPQEWIEKFSAYFNAGEILDHETLRIARTNFDTVAELYEEPWFSTDTKREINYLQERFANFSGIYPVEVPQDIKTDLREYQKNGLNWLNFLDDLNFGGCLADDMGLGKTIQIIAFILLQKAKTGRNTNLLVVPTSVLFNWSAEVEKFAPSLSLLTFYGPNRKKDSRDFDQYDIILTSYGTMVSDISTLKKFCFNYVFLDESQNIKNPGSQRHKAATQLQSRNRVAITGTPIENNTFDLYGQLSFACPGLLGNKQYFKDIYSTPIDKFKVSKRANELRERIKPFILRRTKEQVAAELPEKTEMVVYCEMNEEQRKVYAAYEKEFREFISALDEQELPKNSVHILKGLTMLRQICNSPELLKGTRVKGDSSCKIDELLEQIESKAPAHKILVFSQFVGMLDLIKRELNKRGMKHAYLTGQTRNRRAEVESFENDPEIRVFLISLKAGGTGLNLTAADYVYLVDPWWNPAVENQAIDRCHRIGQKNNIVAVRLICKDTIEEKIMDLQASKKGLANDLIKADGPGLKSLKKTDLLSLL
ncbi:SNF2 family DNA or RNA helicase [Arcticibacter pallidicorallinus]|uniref:SNF2 family DNA or RNA helicase n=1 Tax=Arcticibacter pallidicorallinus TaxID=1259464 RepID=A0A2T0U4P1_9SPHI|nr:DEAD/DEAH box helicase [Arcticibacter pallidicorallinus]PRY52854.1 SNF2 family DNA or RNA helicase [Arcticibacter pallidicorallinus]